MENPKVMGRVIPIAIAIVVATTVILWLLGYR